MTSYETVKRRFKSCNIGLIVINSISLIINVLGIIGLFFIKANLGNAKFTSNYTKEQLSVLKESVSDFTLFIIALTIIIQIIVLIYSVLNLSAIKNNQSINLFPYYLGFALVAVSTLLSIVTNFSLMNLVIQLLIMALYYFNYHYSNIFNNRPSENFDVDSVS